MLYINFPPGYWNLSLKSCLFWTLVFIVIIDTGPWTSLSSSTGPFGLALKKWAFCQTGYAKIKEKGRGLLVCLWTWRLPFSIIHKHKIKLWLSTEPHLILYALIISCTLFCLAIKNSSSYFWLCACMYYFNDLLTSGFLIEWCYSARKATCTNSSKVTLNGRILFKTNTNAVIQKIKNGIS